MLQKTIINTEHIAPIDLTKLFDNQNKYVKPGNIQEALTFLQKIYPTEELQKVPIVRIYVGENNSYDPSKGISLSVTAHITGSLIHEFIHHLGDHHFPLVHKHTDLFLARLIQICYMRYSNNTFNDYFTIPEHKIAQIRAANFHEAWHKKPSAQMFQALVEKIDSMLDLKNEVTDDYTTGVFVSCFFTELTRSTEKIPWSQIFQYIRDLGTYPYKAIEKISL